MQNAKRDYKRSLHNLTNLFDQALILKMRVKKMRQMAGKVSKKKNIGLFSNIAILNFS